MSVNNEVLNETVEEVVENVEESLIKEIDPKSLAACGGIGVALVAAGYIAGKFHVIGRAINGVKNLGRKIFKKNEAVLLTAESKTEIVEETE